MTPLRDAAEIRGYHAHVYFDASTRDLAEALREAIGARFAVELGRVHGEAVGPHPQPMYQVAFGCDELAKIVPWLMLNRHGLAILIHPRTEDEVADHTTHPMWLGTPLPLNADFIRQYREAKRRREAKGAA